MNMSAAAALDVADLGRTVLNNIPDALIYADGNGAIRFWNAGADASSASPLTRR